MAGIDVCPTKLFWVCAACFHERQCAIDFGIVGGGGSMNAAIQYRVSGPDLNQLTAVSGKVMEALKSIPGIVAVEQV